MTFNVIWDLQVFSTEQKQNISAKLWNAFINWRNPQTSARWSLTGLTHFSPVQPKGGLKWPRRQSSRGRVRARIEEGGRWTWATVSENIRRQRLTSGRQAGGASAGWSGSSSPEESPWKHSRMIQDGGIKMNCTTQIIHFWNKRTTWEREADPSGTVCVHTFRAKV